MTTSCPYGETRGEKKRAERTHIRKTPKADAKISTDDPISSEGAEEDGRQSSKLVKELSFCSLERKKSDHEGGRNHAGNQPRLMRRGYRRGSKGPGKWSCPAVMIPAPSQIIPVDGGGGERRVPKEEGRLRNLRSDNDYRDIPGICRLKRSQAFEKSIFARSGRKVACGEKKEKKWGGLVALAVTPNGSLKRRKLRKPTLEGGRGRYEKNCSRERL